MNEGHQDVAGGFLSAISPAFALAYMCVLATRWRSVWRNVRSDRQTVMVLVGMVISGAASSLFAVNPTASWVNMWVPVLFVLIYALGRWGIGDPKGFMRGVVLGCGFLGVVVIVSRLLGLDVWCGTIPVLTAFRGPSARGNVLGMANNGLAAMLEAGVTGGLGLAIYNRSYRWLYVVASLTSLLGICLTLSRGSMVGTFVAVMLLLIMSWRILKSRDFRLPALILLLVFAVALSASPRLERRVKSITSLEANVDRTRIWASVLDMVGDHPIVGIGPGNFGTVFPAYVAPDSGNVTCAHSLYLYILSGWGIIGFIIFYGWLALAMLRPMVTEPASWRRIAFAMVVSFWVHVVFNDLFVAHVPLIMGCLARPELADAEDPTLVTSTS